MACSRRAIFSARRREISASRLRIRRDWVELTRAISRFWRMKRRFTMQSESQLGMRRVMKLVRKARMHLQASMVSMGGGGSFSRAIAKDIK